MDESKLLDHQRAFEDSFFPESRDPLRAELRSEAEAARFSEVLSGLSDIEGAMLLEKLSGMGVGVDGLAALSLFPLVGMAWADGRVDSREKNAVLDAAHAAGLVRGELGHRLLESWMGDEPDPRLLEVWKRYVAAVSSELDEESRRRLQRQILALCEHVAESTGEFLALDKISSSEYKLLQELREAFY